MQGYYKWRKSPVTQRDWDDAHLIAAALLTLTENKAIFAHRKQGHLSRECAENGVSGLIASASGGKVR